MRAATTAHPDPSAPALGTPSRHHAKPGVIDRLRAALGALGAAVMGLAPHLLHHAGPLAGAALFAGIGGTLLFGALGFLLAIPFLLRLRKRHGSWRIPAAVLAVFVGMFLLSALVIGPAITGGSGGSGESQSQSQETAHDAHH